MYWDPSVFRAIFAFLTMPTSHIVPVQYSAVVEPVNIWGVDAKYAKADLQSIVHLAESYITENCIEPPFPSFFALLLT